MRVTRVVKVCRVHKMRQLVVVEVVVVVVVGAEVDVQIAAMVDHCSRFDRH